MKYLLPINLNGIHGLNHHLSNMLALAGYAHTRGYVFIVPKFTLAGYHNKINGERREMRNNLSQYFDYDSLRVDGHRCHYSLTPPRASDAEIVTFDCKNAMLVRLLPEIKDAKIPQGRINYHPSLNRDRQKDC